MDLKFKQPSKESKITMSKVAIGEDNEDYSKIAEDKLCNFTNHNECKLVNSGNAAILTAMNSIEGAILIPNQGGWNGFKQIANFLNKEIITVKTNQGLIEKSHLEEAILNNKELLSNSQNGLFLTSFAAYTAEQNIKEISNFAHENDILIIEDASGAISDSTKKLANGNYSDIIIGSTGSPKIVNVGYGGFITTNNEEIFNKSKIILKTSKINNIIASGISTELDFAKENLNKHLKAANYLKNNLNNVIHQNKRGINVIISSDDKSLFFNLKNELKLDTHGMITKCPNYNRLKIKGVAIELKNLDISCLSKEILDDIINIVNKYQ
ncbi:MAG: DegT/DnrJ/EryC1/StrS family aminotransferase [Methanobacteriaceae archaeon]|nr:DegT/DnrJ/EryC1/StrS family aminotransferase [Methanobacteriaceae archaeon]